MQHLIETQRLLAESLTPADAPELHEVWTNPDVRRYLWDDRVISLEETKDIIERSEQLFAAHGFGLWSLRQRGLAPLIGFGGFWHFREPPELELILGLHPKWWRLGLATEAGVALMRYGFDVLGFSSITGSTDSPNEASIRLMERLGMTRQERRTVHGLDTVFCRAARETWQPRDAPCRATS